MLPGFLDISRTLLQENALSLQFPPGCSFSFPVAARRGGRMLDGMFLYKPAKESALYADRPSHWILLDSLTGEVALYGDCRISDFVDTREYPLGDAVSMELPPTASSKTYTQAYKELYEVYEQLRIFAFDTNLAGWQQEAMTAYRDLFLQAVPMGHYPFYTALSPEFFDWIGLDLETEPMGDQSPAAEQGSPLPDKPVTQAVTFVPLEEMGDPSASETNRRLLSLLEDLGGFLKSQSQAELHRDKLLEDIQNELAGYKTGVLGALTLSLEQDIIKVIDHVERSVEAYRHKNTTKDNFRRLLSLLQGVGTDLTDVLYAHGLEPYTVDGNTVDVQRQKILAVEPTGDPLLDKKTAQRHVCGWEKDGKIVRPERITVYVYEPDSRPSS